MGKKVKKRKIIVIQRKRNDKLITQFLSVYHCNEIE